jgi:SAM-dependent MidA family methyltransferase
MNAEARADEAAREAQARMQLATQIRAAGGWLDFERAMDLLLYAPGWGYYTGGAQVFGTHGDFTTAPELSVLFGQGVAAQIAPLLAATGGDLVEVGAGSGAFAVQLLQELQRLGALPRSYRILELGSELRERQRARLGQLPRELARRVEFLHAPPATDWEGVLVANEVLDALPVQRFALRDGGVLGMGVTSEDDSGRTLRWQTGPATAPLAAEVRRVFADLPWPDAPYVSELCPRVGAWLAALTDKLRQGVALFADYGLPRHEYYHPSRSAGTLRCHYRHRAHEDPWLHPATQDITAWVDFTRVAEAADDAGLDVLGYTTQAAFLLATGIEARVAGAVDELARLRLASEARRLLMPEEMGEVFKLMALGRDVDAPLAGFALRDLRARL